jgi:hypothetical protein
MKARRTLRPRTVDVEGPIAAVAADPPLIVLAAAAVARLDRVALAKAAPPAPARAARIVPRAAVGLLNVLLEDARFLLAVVICVREPSQNSAAGHASAASVKAKGRRVRAIYVESAVAAVSRDAARIIATPPAISRLDLVALSEPAAPTAPRARASAAAPAAVERADEALLDARLGLPVVVGDVKPRDISSRDRLILT